MSPIELAALIFALGVFGFALVLLGIEHMRRREEWHG